MEQLVQLEAAALSLLLAPGAGGSIARFDRRGPDGPEPILRGSEGVPARPLDAACFPLVPFCNRIRGGSFDFRGRHVVLTPNLAGDPSPLHGQGWHGEWRIERAARGEAELVYRHEPGEWPWAYEARQTFVLDANGLSARLSCRNLADEPMPCGLGFHPYFPCHAGTRLATRVSHVWTVDADTLPVERLPATGRYDLSGGPICGRDLDNGFEGWNGEARIHAPGEAVELRLSSPDAGRFQVYSPPGGALFVAEPVSHANDAFAAPEARWPELGLRVLEAGEQMALRMRLDVIERGGGG